MKHIFILISMVGTLLTANGIVGIQKELNENRWVVQFSLEQKAQIKDHNISLAGNKLNTTMVVAPHETLASAALFVIDTSIPMREAYQKGIKHTVESLFKAKNDWDRWGMATFDAELIMLDEFNTTNPTNILSQIRISGQRTELNRASLLAIEKLKGRTEPQKFLMIFSDGEYEDSAYHLEEVIAKAKEAGVKILAFGYRDSINLQNIRRLAEDTGGRLWEADMVMHQLKESDYLDTFKMQLDNIAQFTFDASALQANEIGKQIVDMNVTLEDNTTVTTHIEFDVEKIEPVVEEENTTIAPPTVEEPEKSYLPFIIGGGLLLALLLLLLLLRPKKVEQTEEEEVAPEEREPIAYLETSSGVKYMIVKNQTTIGALAENDIVLEGEYISRHHAVLDLKDGYFYIIDRNSKNGVFVNYEQVQNEQIGDGDIVSFGPLEMVFKVL